jgi:signal transduction histidine kinase
LLAAWSGYVSDDDDFLMSEFIVRQKYLIAITFVVIFAVAVGYVSLDFYIIRSGKELVTSWLANEEVSIQQGNLLSSVSKTQRILLNSDLVKAVRLDDASIKRGALIEIGESFAAPDETRFSYSGEIVVNRRGFGKYVLSARVPGEQSQTLRFLIRPRALIMAYSLFFLTTVTLLMLFAVALMQQARHDQKLRERLLFSALDEFVEQDEPSEILKSSIPAVVNYWSSLRNRFKKLSEEQIGLRVQATLGDIAEKVAHDIRAPLGVIYSIAQRASDIGVEEKSDVLNCALRIKSIADDFLDSSRVVMNNQLTENIQNRKQALDDDQGPGFEVVELSAFIRGEIKQKQKEFLGPSGVDLIFICPPSLDSAKIACSALELARILSNLMNNSIEALDQPSAIYISLFVNHENLVIEIKDRGRGIPAEVLNDLGVKRVTYGKERGNGTALLRASDYLRSINGNLSVESEPGFHTTIQLTIPRLYLPKI